MSIIKEIYKAKQVMEGDGVLVNRVFGHGNTKQFDPFLMLDYFESDTPTKSKGFPWHPHKGIETITYFLRGSGEHLDSMGNKGIIGEGELQWMSAGRGVMHQEMPIPSSNGIQGFQFWVNMRAEDKLNEPHYQYIKNDEMDIYTRNGVKVNVITGEFKGLLGQIRKRNINIRLLHCVVEKGYTLELIRHEGMQGYIFMFEGNASLNEENIESITAYTLDEGEIAVEALTDIQFIFAEGEPLKEPIEWYGPIVMNTRKQIKETLKDLEENTFIK